MLSPGPRLRARLGRRSEPLVDHLEDPDQEVREAGRIALRHGLESFPQDALARLVAEEDIWRRAAEAVLPGGASASASEAVESLVAIYTANPEGFAPGYGDPMAESRYAESAKP